MQILQSLELADYEFDHMFKVCIMSIQGVSKAAPGELHPADFSSIPNQAHLNQLIKVYRVT